MEELMKRDLLRAFIMAALLPLAACSRIADPPGTRDPLDRRALIGTWLLTSEDAIYNSATFRTDSQVVLGCLFCDTIFRYHYDVTDTSLLFTSLDTHEVISNDVVEKLTSDSLVFRTLVANRSRQRYFR
jgi:hypothetical protein